VSESQLPLNDTDFWYLRYGLGIVLPLVIAAYGIYSLVSGHSFTIWGLTGRRSLHLIPVQGEQAYLMGMTYLGIALMLFASCYAQYHEKMGFYYQWILAPGALAAGLGEAWCSWIFVAR
jgi:hypothetical protein